MKKKRFITDRGRIHHELLWWKNWGIGVLMGWVLVGCAHFQPSEPAEKDFAPSRDTFSFRNETKWNYHDGKPAQGKDSEERSAAYVQHCFVMCRAALQFWKFSRFEPEQPVLTPRELGDQIRELCRIDVWKKPMTEDEKIVFPGYPNLRSLSLAQEGVIKENVGLNWPTYFRPGNFKMLLGPSPDEEAEIQKEIQSWLNLGHPSIVWIYRFPKREINHCVLIYRQLPSRGAILRYLAYDPNTPDRPLEITYDPDKKEFSCKKTFYFQGGVIFLRHVYLSYFE